MLYKSQPGVENAAMKRKNIYLLICLAIMILIFWFSQRPGDVSSKQSGLIVSLLAFFHIRFSNAQFIVRKAAHFTIYLFLGLFLFLYCKESKPDRSFCQNLLLSLICSFLYATSDEIHQLFIAGRAGQFKDVLLDTSGAFTGSLLSILCYKIKMKTKKEH